MDLEPQPELLAIPAKTMNGFLADPKLAPWKLALERKSQVGSGDRSEKIRTYNFPQNRLTDHRIGLTNHQLAMVMEGQIQPTIDALIAHYTAEKLKAETEAA